jgi:Cytochrome C oxidase, cbb3-type, subunit III
MTIMKIRWTIICGIYSALTLSALGSGIDADVPFAFRVGVRDLPAGKYSFAYNDLENTVQVRGGGTDINVPVKTRLRGPTGTLDFEGTLVFDRKDEVRLLSEVWLPQKDGFQVGALPDSHTHVVLNVVQRPTETLSGPKIFQQTCQVCHGPDGKGNPAADEFFHYKLPRLNSAYVQGKSDAELREIISHGKGRMDPVRLQETTGIRHSLPSYAVDPLIAYVRTLASPSP